MYIYMYVSLSDRENISSQLFRYLSLSPSADKYVNRAGVSLVREGTQSPGLGFKALLVLNEGNNFSLKIGKPTLQGVLNFFSKVFKERKNNPPSQDFDINYFPLYQNI